MLSLDSKRWVCFILSDVFDIRPTLNGIDREKLMQGEEIYPYVTRSNMNNGVYSFVCLQEGYEINRGNCITVGSDTQTVFYQPMDFYTGANVNILRNEHLNQYSAKFFLPLLHKSLSTMNYGRGATVPRLKRSRIMLPVDDEGKPDYAFMEEYIREIEQKMIHEYIEHAKMRLSELPNESLSLEGKRWGKFAIGDLFSVEIGKSIDGNKVDREAGMTAYITRKESNNGLDGFIDYEEEYLNTKHPVITIGNETAEPFVQEYPFFTGTKVNILTPKTPQTKEALMFVSMSLKMHKEKYSYAYTINSTRLKHQVIQLPVNESGQPDWEFMTQYMKAIEYERLLRYLKNRA